MEYRIYETPKSGLEDDQNEDAVHVRKLKDSVLMVNVSDGASTGVFSKVWSDHLTADFDSAWLESPEEFAKGLANLRESFKPDIKRPTALRKFLMEGSYATLSSVLLECSPWWWGHLKLKHYSVGDVCIFVFSKDGMLQYSFPQNKKNDFSNVPDLIRTTEKLQEKTPIEIKHDTFEASRSSLVLVVSDALAEFIFQREEELGRNGREVIKEIVRCKNDDEFRTLMDGYRKDNGMKNDDCSICLVTNRPDLYFKDDLWNTPH